MDYQYQILEPILDKKELTSLDNLNKQFEKITTPNKTASSFQNAVSHVRSKLPAPIKSMAVQTSRQLKSATGNITQVVLFNQLLKILNESYGYLQGQLLKFTISDTQIVKHVSNKLTRPELSDIQDFTLLRSYEISKVVNSIKLKNFTTVFIEAGATGALGFPGLPLNLLLSNLLYFRVVQEVATYYGYDVKNDNSEMAIAGEVFALSLNPTLKIANNELSETILKTMTLAELQATKFAAKKGWSEMIKHGGVPLMLTQTRALANKAAAKALVKAGQKGIEFGVFKTVFEQVGKIITLKATSKSIPVVSSGISALIDSHQMNKVFDYANIYYQKRFILEKETRVQELMEIKYVSSKKEN